MATIVRHIATDIEYVLLGAGFGAFRASRPSFLLGDLMPNVTKGNYSLALICNDAGEVGWVSTEEIEVVRVDGHTPAQAITGG